MSVSRTVEVFIATPLSRKVSALLSRERRLRPTTTFNVSDSRVTAGLSGKTERGGSAAIWRSLAAASQVPRGRTETLKECEARPPFEFTDGVCERSASKIRSCVAAGDGDRSSALPERKLHGHGHN